MNLKKQQGFTLIELMIVIAIIAILAAIALPAYQDYTVRAKVSELIVAGDACKGSVTEFYESKGRLPANISSAGCSSNTSQWVQSLTVLAGGIVNVTATADTSLATAASKLYALKPVETDAATHGGVLTWTCNSAAGTTIPLKYLPAVCR